MGEVSQIPKIIHYCWFGKGKLPDSAIKCMESWKKYFPGYEIKQWNEDNFDINSIRYTKEAYERKKYAFVSDYARFWILYNYGGVYFDTDVEVIKPMDDIINAGPYMGCERDGADDSKKSKHQIAVNSGLGIAAVPKMKIYEEILQHYESASFINPNGEISTISVVTRVTNVLIEQGLKDICCIQDVCGIKIYPKVYFCPNSKERQTQRYNEKTYSAHHYDGSWRDEKYNKRQKNFLWRLYYKLATFCAKIVKKIVGKKRWDKLKSKHKDTYNKFRGI